MSYCSRSRRRRFTVLDSKVEHIAAFTAIFSNICTVHVQKWLLINFRCKFKHRRSIRRPRFPIRVQNRLKPNLSCGPDGLPPLLFKRLKDSLAYPLALIFTQLFSVGIIPDEWKNAIISPVFKKDLREVFLIIDQYLLHVFHQS